MDQFSPILSPVRTPLRDTTNQYSSGGSKKSEGVTPKGHLTFTKDEGVEEELNLNLTSTPKKTPDCDPESDTTAEYESAGEASPWGKEPNLSSLADCLAGVHLSTPDKKVHAELKHFPFSPITAEDESDEEITAIISNKGHNSNTGSLSLMEDEDVPEKNSSLGDGNNTPFVIISPSQIVANSSLEKRNEHNSSLSAKSDSFRVITEPQPGDSSQSLSLGENLSSASGLQSDKPSPISPSVEFQDAGPACSFHSEVMTNIEAQLLSGTPNTSLISSNSLIIEECRHADSAQTSFNSQEISDENQIIDEKCNIDKSFTNFNKKLNLSIIQETESESIAFTEDANIVNELTIVKDINESISQQNLSGSLKDMVVVGEQPSNLVEPSPMKETNCETPPNKVQSTTKIFTSSDSDMSSLIENSENRTSEDSSKEDLNKSVSLKDILFDRSIANISTDSVQNLSVTEQIEASISHSITEESAISTIEPAKSDNVNCENSLNKSENPLKLEVSLGETSEETVIALAKNAIDISKSDSHLLEISKDEKVLEAGQADFFNLDSANIKEDVSKLSDDSHSIELEKVLKSPEVLVPYEKVVINSASEFINETKEQTSYNPEHKDIKCAFSQNSTNLSENVLKFANEKHPICLKEASEGLDSVLPPKEIILPSLENVAAPESIESMTENDKNEQSCENISISEMCNLIETTFNNSLKENFEEICENITSTNLKPISILLENDKGESTQPNLASSPVEKNILTPTSVPEDVSSALEVESENNSVVEKNDEQMSLKLVNTPPSLEHLSTSDGSGNLLPIIIDSVNTINEVSSSEDLNSKPLDATVVSADQNVYSLPVDNHNFLNSSAENISAETINHKTTEIKKPMQMVNVEVIPCFPFNPSSAKSKNSPVIVSTVCVKESENDRQKSKEVSKLIISEAKSINVVSESITSKSNIVVADCVVTSSTVARDTSSCTLPTKLSTGQSTNVLVTDTQNVNLCISSTEQILTHETNAAEHSKIIDTSSKILNPESNESSLHTEEDLRTIKNSENDSLSGLVSVTTDNVSTMLVSQSTQEIPSSLLRKSSDNKSNEEKAAENELCNSINVFSSNLELDTLSECNALESSNKLNNSERKCSESNPLSTPTDKHNEEMVPTNSSSIEVAHSTICDVRENELANIAGKIESSSVIDYKSTYSELSIESKPENSKISAISDSMKAGYHWQTNAIDNSTVSLQSHLNKSNKICELVEGIAKLKVDLQEELFVSKNISELTNSQKKPTTSEVNSNSSNREINVLKPSTNECTNEMKTTVQNIQKGDVQDISFSGPKSLITLSSNKEIHKAEPLPNEEITEKNQLSQSNEKVDDQEVSISKEGFAQKSSFITSPENGVMGVRLEDGLSTIGSNKADVNPGSSSQQLFKGDLFIEKNVSSHNKADDLPKSPPNKSLKNSKQNDIHNSNGEHKLNTSEIERKSYNDLLDKCSEQERLLDFDESIKEEADKIVKELENLSSTTNFVESEPSNLPSPKVNNTSEAGPTTADEDMETGDTFQDAANFDFEYLSKIHGKPGHRQKLRESLFLKFDPLASSTSPNLIIKQEPLTPKMEQSLKQIPDSSTDKMITPPREPLNREEQLVCITPIPQLVQSTSPASTNTTPPVKLRRSTGSATPSLRHDFLSKEINKLQELLFTQESSYQEQLAAYVEEIDELKLRLAELEEQQPEQKLVEQVMNGELEIQNLTEQLENLERKNKEYIAIIKEYDQTAFDILKKKHELEAEVEELRVVKEESEQHLRNMEIAFNDVHQKYEKCKEAITLFQQNEIQYKVAIQSSLKEVAQKEENYQKLKEHATQKLEEASKEIIEMKKAHQAEVAKLEALNKKMEIQVKSAEENLEQKRVEVEGLTKICEELINRFPKK